MAPTLVALRFNPGLCLKKPATNLLAYWKPLGVVKVFWIIHWIYSYEYGREESI